MVQDWILQTVDCFSFSNSVILECDNWYVLEMALKTRRHENINSVGFSCELCQKGSSDEAGFGMRLPSASDVLCNLCKKNIAGVVQL